MSLPHRYNRQCAGLDGVQWLSGWDEQRCRTVGDGPQRMAEGRRQALGGEHLGDRTEDMATCAVEQQHVAGVAGGQVDVVEDHRHTGAGGSQGAEVV